MLRGELRLSSDDMVEWRRYPRRTCLAFSLTRPLPSILLTARLTRQIHNNGANCHNLPQDLHEAREFFEVRKKKRGLERSSSMLLDSDGWDTAAVADEESAPPGAAQKLNENLSILKELRKLREAQEKDTAMLEAKIGALGERVEQLAMERPASDAKPGRAACAPAAVQPVLAKQPSTGMESVAEESVSVGLHSCWTPPVQEPVLDSSAALQNAASQNAALQRARMAGMAMAMRPRPEAGEVTYSMLHGRGGGRPNGLPRARPSSSPDRPTSPLPPRAPSPRPSHPQVVPGSTVKC